MMGHAPAVVCRRFGGTYLQLAINRHRIATHDFALEMFCQAQRERGLAAGRGPKYHHQQWQLHALLQRWRRKTNSRMSRATMARPRTCWRRDSIESSF